METLTFIIIIYLTIIFFVIYLVSIYTIYNPDCNNIIDTYFHNEIYNMFFI
jgi:hypothetical protein